jgi:hypothetical protein
MAAQQPSEFHFHLAKAVEACPIEMAHAQIHGEIQQTLAIPSLGQPHQACTTKADRRGDAASGQGDGGQHQELA